jgi:hypothetical protein
LGISGKKPYLLKFNDNKNIFMGTFCRGGYAYDNGKQTRVKKSNTCQFYSKLRKKMLPSTKPYACIGENTDSPSATAAPNTYACKHVLHKAQFSANRPDQAKSRYGGYALTFTAHSAPKTASPFKVVFDIKCKPTDKGGKPVWKQTKNSESSYTFSAESKFGCQTMDLSFMQPLRMFMGAFEILCGIALCFFGAKFLPYALQFLAFLFCSGVVFALGNVMLDFYSTNHVPLIATSVVALIAGCVGGFLFKRFIEAWGVTLLALVGGIMVGVMVTAAIPMNKFLKYGIIVVLGAVAAFFGNKFDKQLKVLGTALIGAGLMMHGAGQYIGGFPNIGSPSVGKLKSNWGYLGYFAGWLAFSAGGAFVQSKYTHATEGGEDAFGK